MKQIEAPDGKWLFDGAHFIKGIATSGDTSMWQEVTDEFKIAFEEAEKQKEEAEKQSEEQTIR